MTRYRACSFPTFITGECLWCSGILGDIFGLVVCRSGEVFQHPTLVYYQSNPYHCAELEKGKIHSENISMELQKTLTCLPNHNSFCFIPCIHTCTFQISKKQIQIYFFNSKWHFPPIVLTMMNLWITLVSARKSIRRNRRDIWLVSAREEGGPKVTLEEVRRCFFTALSLVAMFGADMNPRTGHSRMGSMTLVSKETPSWLSDTEILNFLSRSDNWNQGITIKFYSLIAAVKFCNWFYEHFISVHVSTNIYIQ